MNSSSDRPTHCKTHSRIHFHTVTICTFVVVLVGAHPALSDTKVPGKPYPESYDTPLGAMAILLNEYKQSKLVYFHMEPRLSPGSGGAILGIIQLDNKGSYAVMCGGDGQNTDSQFTINGKPVHSSEQLLFTYIRTPTGISTNQKIVVSGSSPGCFLFSLGEGDDCEISVSENKGRSVPQIDLAPAAVVPRYRQTIVVGRKSSAGWYSHMIARNLDLDNKLTDPTVDSRMEGDSPSETSTAPPPVDSK